nr:MAG TPA: hypothetical protein [Picobirnaviridae sp.]
MSTISHFNIDNQALRNFRAGLHYLYDLLSDEDSAAPIHEDLSSVSQYLEEIKQVRQFSDLMSSKFYYDCTPLRKAVKYFVAVIENITYRSRLGSCSRMFIARISRSVCETTSHRLKRILRTTGNSVMDVFCRIYDEMLLRWNKQCSSEPYQHDWCTLVIMVSYALNLISSIGHDHDADLLLEELYYVF